MPDGHRTSRRSSRLIFNAPHELFDQVEIISTYFGVSMSEACRRLVELGIRDLEKDYLKKKNAHRHPKSLPPYVRNRGQ